MMYLNWIEKLTMTHLKFTILNLSISFLFWAKLVQFNNVYCTLLARGSCEVFKIASFVKQFYKSCCLVQPQIGNGLLETSFIAVSLQWFKFTHRSKIFSVNIVDIDFLSFKLLHTTGMVITKDKWSSLKNKEYNQSSYFKLF